MIKEAVPIVWKEKRWENREETLVVISSVDFWVGRFLEHGDLEQFDAFPGQYFFFFRGDNPPDVPCFCNTVMDLQGFFGKPGTHILEVFFYIILHRAKKFNCLLMGDNAICFFSCI